MGAREKLRACFPTGVQGVSNDLIERAVDEILDEHVMELADQLRNLAGSPAQAVSRGSKATYRWHAERNAKLLEGLVRRGS